MMKVLSILFSGYGYCLELLISMGLVIGVVSLQKKDIWRVVVAIIGLFLLSSVWSLVEKALTPVYITPLRLGLYDMIEYCSFFAYIAFAVWIISKQRGSGAIFLAVGAYSIQHLVYKIAEVCSYMAGIAGVFVSTVVYLVVEGGLYVAAYLLFGRYFQKIRGGLLRASSVFMLVAGMLLIAVVLQYSVEDASSYYYIYAFYDIISGVLLLFIMRSIIVNGELKSEYEMLEYIRWQENEQYELARKNIELLDIKLHDIKHLIYGLRSRMSEEDFYDIEKLISVYDMTVKTDNEVLDIIFSQKSLECEQNHIRFEKVVNGELLRFMETADIYSMFCNAIDNAIDACLTNKNEERRIISLMVRKTMNMAHIHIENYFEGEIKFKDGLPVTTKKKKDFHGFGTKSIRNIVTKYKGSLNFSAKDGIFCLDILFPLPNDK